MRLVLIAYEASLWILVAHWHWLVASRICLQDWLKEQLGDYAISCLIFMLRCGRLSPSSVCYLLTRATHQVHKLTFAIHSLVIPSLQFLPQFRLLHHAGFGRRSGFLLSKYLSNQFRYWRRGPSLKAFLDM